MSEFQVARNATGVVRCFPKVKTNDYRSDSEWGSGSWSGENGNDSEGKVIFGGRPPDPASICRLSGVHTLSHDHCTVKANQATLLSDIELYFQNRQESDFIDNAP